MWITIPTVEIENKEVKQDGAICMGRMGRKMIDP